MAEETPDEVVEEIVEKVEEETDETNWDRMRSLVGEVVEEKLGAWQEKQPKMTSSNSRRKAAEKKPERKQGFLSKGFF